MTTLTTTPQGFTFDLNQFAKCSAWKEIDHNGKSQISQLSFTGKTAIRHEFMEDWTEFEMVDQFGDYNFISEQDLIQHL